MPFNAYNLTSDIFLVPVIFKLSPSKKVLKSDNEISFTEDGLSLQLPHIYSVNIIFFVSTSLRSTINEYIYIPGVNS